VVWLGVGGGRVGRVGGAGIGWRWRGTGRAVTESHSRIYGARVQGNSGEFRLGGAESGGNGQNPTNWRTGTPFDEIGTKMHNN
jgi:hypothetical protein